MVGVNQYIGYHELLPLASFGNIMIVVSSLVAKDGFPVIET